MSSPGHLNISSQDGTSNILGELPLPRTYRDDGAEHVRILTVSHCGLSSLTASPNSRLALVLPFITTFQAPHNKLRRLTGLDAMPSLELLNLSHNELHQMDRHSCQLLKALPHIRVVDLSHNKLQLMELGATLQHHHGDPNNTAGGSGGLQRAAAGYVEAEDCALHITSLNLSHNVLVEVPDLRCLPSLQILNLDYNRIEHLTDLDQRLPLLSIHTLQLRRNRIRHVSSLVPLAAMAESLHHVQLYGNPFTMEAGQHHHQHHHQQQQHRQSSSSVMGGAKAWWWRPVLLWLAPLLNTLDLVEFTYSEHTAAINHLFRERGAISLKLLELLNAQQKDELEKYLRKMSERVSAPADLPDIIQAIEEEDELESGEEDDAAGDVLEEEDDDDDDDHHQQQQQHPMTSTSTPERVMEEEEGEPAPPSAEMLRIPLSAHINNASLANMNAGGTYSSAISPDPIGPGRESPQLPTPTTTTATATATLGRGDAALAQVVRAMQQKVKSLSGVVETLWREDVVRRSFAAVVIQRHMRGALARMHLPEETREMCGFIRHQLRLYNSPRYYASLMVMNTPPQQHHASAPPTPPPPAAAAVGASSSSSCAGAPASSGIVEVLATMKSLQNVISTMWADLDEFRIMSQREQERAARLIQRFYRGYAARKSWRMLKAGYDEFVASLVPYVCHIQRAGRGFVERRRLEREVRGPREVHRLRCEVMDLRAQLHEVQKVLMDKLGVQLSSSRLAKDINLNAPSAVMLPTDESTPSSARSTATH